VGKRCACKLALARSADPTASREAKERADRARIRAELVAPAEAAIAAALGTSNIAVWRVLLQAIDSRAKVADDADVNAIQAAIAASLVNTAVKYNLDYSPDYASCRQQLNAIFKHLGLSAPWSDQASGGDEHEAQAREHLTNARELAGHPMVPAYLKQARHEAEQIVDVDVRAALLTEIAAAADVCAQTPAAGDEDSPLLALSERLSTIEAWIAQAAETEPDLAAVLGTRETLEDIADDLDELSDDESITDDAFEDLAQRIGQATMALINLAEAGAAPTLAEVEA